MSSTAYLVDKGSLSSSHARPFSLGWIYSRMSYSFNWNDLASNPKNQSFLITNDKLWISIRKLFETQKRFVITIFFKETSPRGIHLRVCGPFLKKLKDVYEDFPILKLKLTLSHQSKSWSIDIGLNNIRREHGIIRIVYSERSQRLFRRIAALPDLNVSLRLTTRVNAVHTRRVLSRHLLNESTPYNFHLISENGTRVGFHKELLAAHSDVFGCPSVQSKDDFQLFVSDYILVVLKNYVYREQLKDFKRDQRIAFELLESAHFYNIAGLERIMRKKLMALVDVPGDMGLDLAILLYSFASKIVIGYEQLGEKTLVRIKNTRRSEIEASDAFQFITRNDEHLGEFLRTSGIPRCINEE